MKSHVTWAAACTCSVVAICACVDIGIKLTKPEPVPAPVVVVSAPAPYRSFWMGDTEAGVAKAQGAPREIWGGSKATGDEGNDVWVYYGGKDDNSTYTAANYKDVIWFDQKTHLVTNWENRTGDLHVGVPDDKKLELPGNQ
jgi:hypothetical protein